MRSRSFVGILAGTAAGDAWGWPNEFKRLARMNPPMPAPAVVTDDTQMSFIVADVVLHELETGCSRAESLRRTLAGFERWRTDADNNRAPGVATMAALAALARGRDIASATQIDSKGAGALMRVAPAAALGGARARSYGLEQAVITHGHPSSSVACAVMLEVVTALSEHRIELADALEAGLAANARLSELDVADSIRSRFGADYLAFGRRELGERMLTARERVHPPRRIDPAKIAGRSGCAEDVLVGALTALALRAGDPMDALRLCAGSSGDADTVAAVAGALIGARTGPEPFADLIARLEPRYAGELDSLSVRSRRTLSP